MKTIALITLGLAVAVVSMGSLAWADVYVSGTGVDAAGNGTLASPYRTITYALANRGGDAVIRVGAGLYTDDNDDVDDESFPITVPAGVSLIGTMGSLRDDTDSAVVNAGGAAKAFVLATSTSGTATFSNLVITNFIGPAIDLTGWRGTIDGCYITGSVAGATNALVFLHLPLSSGATDPTRPIDLRVTNTVMENLTNAGANHVLLFSNNGNGKTYFTDCVFKDIRVGQPDRGAMNWEWSTVNYDVQLTAVTIDNVAPTGTIDNPQMGILYTARSTGILDRCIIRNINKNGPMVNSNNAFTVRNSLFCNLKGNPNYGAVFASNGASASIYNCTFDDCTAVTNSSDGIRYIYNSSISNCTQINSSISYSVRLSSVNVYNTSFGVYDADNSSNITAHEPKYRDAAGGDFHLRGNSLLVDAGNNAHVTWATPVDVDGNPRILDGNFDATATVDIGADEFTTSPAAPTFSVQPFFHVFAGSILDVPVSIVPPAGESVDADVAYDAGLTGASALTIADGTGPATLAVAVDGASGTAAGNPMDVAFTDAAGVVLPANCTIVSYTNTVTLAGSTKVFLAAGSSLDLPVKLMSPSLAAPFDVPITVGSPSGTGTNSINWVGGASISQGAAQSAGTLSIIAAGGANSISLTVGGGFSFDEAGGSTLDLQVICLSSPIHVAGAGSDVDGIGTADSPFRSITKALTFVPAVMAIQVGPGLYDSDNGETFRINVPPGVSITGSRGPEGDESDSSVIDGGGVLEVFRLRDTAAGTAGLISGLVIRNFMGPAINLTAWRGTIDNCYITGGVAGATAALIFYHAAGALDIAVTNTVMENIVNGSAKHVFLFNNNGSGKTYFTNCTFKDITVGNPDRGAMSWEWSGVNYDIKMTSVIIDHIVVNGDVNNAQMGILYTAQSTGIFDRCIVRNINKNGPVINSNKTLTVRDSLFYNLTGGTWGAVFASNGNIVNAYNCTFDGCQAVTNTSGGSRYFYNCSISNCTKVNSYTTSTMQLKSVNVYQSDIGLYDSNGSSAITAFVPNYRDPATFDFRLKKTSALVDAGNEAYVTWADPVDLLGAERVLDGNNDETAAPDLGAYEYDPNVLVPTFVTSAANYAAFAGDAVTIPVSIAPAVGDAVVADITLGFGLSGPGTLSIPDGHGPVDLIVNAASDAGLDAGNVIDIDITLGSGPSVEPTACTVTVYTKQVKVAGTPRIFLPEGESDSFPVSLMSPSLAAPAEISFTVGAPTGSGTNTISWSGGTTIPAGTSQSSGSLSVTAGTGLNTVHFTVSGGFTFAETGTDTLDFDVVGFASPIYVAGTGSDTAGAGSETSPLRTITKALALLASTGDPTGMEIHVLPGLYDADSGEVFKLVVPPGVSIIGTRGEIGDETDSAVLDAGATATVLRLATTPSGTTGLVSGLVMKNFFGPAVDLTGWRGTIDDCLITESVRGVCNALIFYHQIGTVDLTVTNTEMVNMTNQDAKHVVLFGDTTGTGTTGFAGCVFKDITVGTCYGARGSMNWEWNQVFTISFTDTVLDHVTFTSPDVNNAQTGLFRPSSNPFTLDRCVIANMNQNTTTISANGAGTGTIRDCLFYNNNNGSWGVIGGANGANLRVYSSTFDSCSAVTSTNGSAGSVVTSEYWNCSISNCAKINIYTTPNVKLHYVNVFNSTYGTVDLDHSDNLTSYDPNYVNPDEFNFRLKKVSRLIDAGDNSFVAWSDPTDLDGKPRIMDGNADEVDTVDLGAYEYDPNVLTPTFTTAAATCNLFAGASLDVPVSIVPPAGDAVTASVSYGTDLSGPATLAVPNGSGPASLTVTAASPLSQPSGTLSAVSLTESSSVGVEPGEFGIYVYERAVTIGGSARLFAKAGNELQIKVRFLNDQLAAPGAVNVATGAPEGTGTNAIAWTGDAFIPDGGAESAGYLSIVGGTGANSVTLTVDNAFAFSESGAAAVTIQVIGFASPLYVSGAGDDESGDGSIASPLRTITYAASLLADGDEVRVLDGTYGPSSGEVMPIEPGGVRIVGDGPAAGQVIDGETTAFSMVKFREIAGAHLENLTFTRCTEPAVLLDHSTVELTGCTFTAIVCRDIPGVGFKAAALNMINDAQVTATDCAFTHLEGRSAVEIENHTLNNANLFVGVRCQFTNNYSFWGTVASTASVAGRYELTECLFEGNRVPMDGHTQDSDSGTVAYLWGHPSSPGRFIMNRCTVLDGSGGCVLGIGYTSRANYKVTNSLFAGNQCRLSMLDSYNYGVDITNCTIVNNTGGFNRWVPNGTERVNLRNCIIANNDYMAAAGGVVDSVVLTNCILWNTPPGDGTGYNLALSSNVIEQDPLLVDASAATLDARLTDASPALEAGDDTLVPADALVDLDGAPRFHDADGDEIPTVDIGCYEYQGVPGAAIAAFTVSDRTSGSTLVTNEAAVTVAITVDVPEGITVVSWQITESDAEPAEWLAAPPTAYTIAAAPGADVTLYAWIKDSDDNVAGKPAAIYYDTRVPVVSNAAVTDNGNNTATATWTTDIPAEGSLNYGPVAMSGATPNTIAENALGTSHSASFPIAAGTNYKLVLVNTEVASAPIYWPKAWPIDGDANMDCRVNILDLIFIRNKLNLDVATGDNWKADVNEDTRINILDLIYVRNKLNTQCP